LGNRILKLGKRTMIPKGDFPPLRGSFLFSKLEKRELKGRTKDLKRANERTKNCVFCSFSQNSLFFLVNPLSGINFGLFWEIHAERGSSCKEKRSFAYLYEMGKKNYVFLSHLVKKKL